MRYLITLTLLMCIVHCNHERQNCTSILWFIHSGRFWPPNNCFMWYIVFLCVLIALFYVKCLYLVLFMHVLCQKWRNKTVIYFVKNALNYTLFNAIISSHCLNHYQLWRLIMSFGSLGYLESCIWGFTYFRQVTIMAARIYFGSLYIYTNFIKVYDD